MSVLKGHLDAFHDEYVAVAYPGDLAAEMLPTRLPWRRIAWVSSGFGFGSLAAAAAVVLMIGRLNLAPPTAPQPVAGRIVEVADQHLAQLRLPSLPDWSILAHTVGLDDYDRFLPDRLEQLRKLITSPKPADATDDSHRA